MTVSENQIFDLKAARIRAAVTNAFGVLEEATMFMEEQYRKSARGNIPPEHRTVLTELADLINDARAVTNCYAVDMFATPEWQASYEETSWESSSSEWQSSNC